MDYTGAILTYLSYLALTRFILPSSIIDGSYAEDGMQVSALSGYIITLIVCAMIIAIIRRPGPKQKIEGAIFMTGCDSGMGEVSAYHLAKIGFHIYAGCYSPKSKEKLAKQAEEQGIPPERLVYVNIDVTKEESVEKAYALVKKSLEDANMDLIGLINCAGVGYNGPIEYLPMRYYREQMDVNYFGYVHVAQTFLPLIKKAVSDPNSRRGRIVFVGTGGGPMSPAPALLSAYMGSKWAGEAYMQCFRMEMQLQRIRIDGSMVNPGFIKPTALVDGGKALMERMWRDTPKEAKDEYKWMCDRFVQFSDDEPGTHPRYIAAAMEEIFTVHRPELSYRVGIDSKCAPIVGLIPTPLREWLVRAQMYKVTDYRPN